MSWRDRAECKGRTRLFFGYDGERGYAVPGREARAKRVCARCEVRSECLAWALRTREPFGVAGGLSAAERFALKRRRRAA